MVELANLTLSYRDLCIDQDNFNAVQAIPLSEWAMGLGATLICTMLDASNTHYLQHTQAFISKNTHYAVENLGRVIQQIKSSVLPYFKLPMSSSSAGLESTKLNSLDAVVSPAISAECVEEVAFGSVSCTDGGEYTPPKFDEPARIGFSRGASVEFYSRILDANHTQSFVTFLTERFQETSGNLVELNLILGPEGNILPPKHLLTEIGLSAVQNQTEVIQAIGEFQKLHLNILLREGRSVPDDARFGLLMRISQNAQALKPHTDSGQSTLLLYPSSVPEGMGGEFVILQNESGEKERCSASGDRLKLLPKAGNAVRFGPNLCHGVEHQHVNNIKQQLPNLRMLIASYMFPETQQLTDDMG